MAVYTCDANGIIREYNRRAVELWGREPGGNGDEPRFCGSYKIYHPDGRQCRIRNVRWRALCAAKNLSRKIWKLSLNVPLARGDTYSGAADFERHHGKIIGAINSLLDITERSVLNCRNAIGGVGPVVPRRGRGKDLNGIITDWNQGAQRIFGYKPKEIIGKSILTLIPKSVNLKRQEILRRIRRGESIGSLRNDPSPQGWKIDRRFVDNFTDQRPARQNCRRFQNRSQHHRT